MSFEKAKAGAHRHRGHGKAGQPQVQEPVPHQGQNDPLR